MNTTTIDERGREQPMTAPAPATLERYAPPSLIEADRVSAFLAAESGRALPEKRRLHRWKLTANPNGTAIASAAVAPNGDIVSTCTLVPKRLWAGGAEEKWAEIGDTFTRRDFQRRGLFSKCVRSSWEHGEREGNGIIYGLPNDQSAPGYLKLGYRIKEGVTFVEQRLPLSAVALTRLPRLARARAVLEHPITARATRRLVRPLLDLAAPPRSGSFWFSSTTRFGSEFDELWTRARGDDAYLGVRDARYLSWRFGESPFAFETLLAWSGPPSAARLAGYAVILTVQPRPDESFRSTFLVDWFFDRKENGIAAALLDRAIDTAVASESDAITALSLPGSPWALPFEARYFRSKPSPLPMIVAPSDRGERFRTEFHPLHFCLCDTDTF